VNWLKKGPELKAPSLEVPTFLSDLYYDLRERRLLPLLALALVAIAAVPFLLGGSEEEPAGGHAVAGASNARNSSFTVVESKPGLREYQKRLSHRSPTNPFKQRFSNPANLNEAQLPESEGAPSTNPEGGTGSGTGESETSPGRPGSQGIVFFAWGIDVEIKKVVPGGSGGGAGGGEGQQPQSLTAAVPATESSPSTDGTVPLSSKTERTLRHKVLPQTPLPSPARPVATYMGLSSRGKPLFLVSEQVKGVFGETQCLLGGEACQLVEVPLNFPITFVWGANNVRYTFNVRKKELVVTGHAER
jgi:hypothetical protein